MVKTYIIEGEKTDHLFWVESVYQYDSKGQPLVDDSVFYQVDFGDATKFMYAGPHDAHKDVLVDTVLRLVNQKRFPPEILDKPIRTW